VHIIVYSNGTNTAQNILTSFPLTIQLLLLGLYLLGGGISDRKIPL